MLISWLPKFLFFSFFSPVASSSNSKFLFPISILSILEGNFCKFCFVKYALQMQRVKLCAPLLGYGTNKSLHIDLRRMNLATSNPKCKLLKVQLVLPSDKITINQWGNNVLIFIVQEFKIYTKNKYFNLWSNRLTKFLKDICQACAELLLIYKIRALKNIYIN